MHRQLFVALVICTLAAFTGCTNSQNSSSSSSSSSASAAPGSSAAPEHTALPTTAKTPVTFNFTDVATATGGANTLRVGFDIKNDSQDPLLCDPSEFNVQLDDGSVIAADQSADNSCDPNSVDPKSTGKAVMYFDVPSNYTGNVTLFLVVNDVVVGQGITSVK